MIIMTNIQQHQEYNKTLIMTTLKLTDKELEVLKEMISFFYDAGIPDGMNQEAYDSVVDKVLGE